MPPPDPLPAPRPAVLWRYRAWLMCVALVLAVPPVWAVADAGRWPRWTGDAAHAALWIADVALVLLLCTTPVDAIRLPVGRSVLWIGAITAWAYGTKAVRLDPLSLSLPTVVVLAGGAAGMAWAIAKAGLSPWWVGVILWAPAPLRPFDWPASLTGSAVYCVVVLVALIVAVRRRLAAPA